jgi:hypothetical protein
MRILYLLIFIFFINGCSNSSDPIESNSTTTDQDKDIVQRVYGTSLNYQIEILNFEDITLYKPKNIDPNIKIPFLLFAPGWGSEDHNSYKTILSFIASQGYIALYSKSPMEYSANKDIYRFSKALNDERISKYLDKNRFGVLGHSSGGGIIFKLLLYFSQQGYGKDGRFVFSMDPWFSFEMSEDDFKSYPKNTKVVIQQYVNHTETDPRISLAIYDHLSILGDENRDYQVYKDLDHGYPIGNVSFDKKQTILKPLDALMDLVFNSNSNAYRYAMGIGCNGVCKDQPILSVLDYEYKCYGETSSLINILEKYGIDYCSSRYIK